MSPLPSPMLPLPRLSFSCANGWHHVRRSRQSMVAGCARHGSSAPASSAAMPGLTPRPSWRSAAAMRAARVRSRHRGAGVPCRGHGGWGRGTTTRNDGRRSLDGARVLALTVCRGGRARCRSRPSARPLCTCARDRAPKPLPKAARRVRVHAKVN